MVRPGRMRYETVLASGSHNSLCAQPVSASLKLIAHVVVEDRVGGGPVGFSVEQQDLIWAM